MGQGMKEGKGDGIHRDEEAHNIELTKDALEEYEPERLARRKEGPDRDKSTDTGRKCSLPNDRNENFERLQVIRASMRIGRKGRSEAGRTRRNLRETTRLRERRRYVNTELLLRSGQAVKKTDGSRIPDNNASKTVKVLDHDFHIDRRPTGGQSYGHGDCMWEVSPNIHNRRPGDSQVA